MPKNDFTLEVPQGHSRRLIIGWLSLALASLVIAGLFTILIVLSRTPFFHQIIPWVDFFKTALVVHVDMTVLVWFLAFAGVFWSLMSRGRCCGWLALVLAIIGTFVMSSAPFFGEGYPLMNNYVPVLQQPIFLVGLAIFGLGFTALVLHSLVNTLFIGDKAYLVEGDGRSEGAKALRFGLLTAMLTALFAIMALVWSYAGIPFGMESGQSYYEMLFWGGGHVLQFTHTQLMLVAWLWLATVSGMTLSINPRIVIILFVLGMAPALLTPLIYFAYEVGSAHHIIAFTWQMQYGGGLAALPLALVILWGLVKGASVASTAPAERSALVFSILLFGVGGLIGFLIRDSNVTIPAHYHGSIVAVTIAYMGITYHLMPRLGFREVSGKWAKWQPTIYGSGQILHVLGLAWSGGHGIARKTAGEAQGLEGFQQVAAMGLVGLGGLIAIIGVVIFLVVILVAMRPMKSQ